MIWGCLYKPAALRPCCRVPDRRSICLPPASRVRQMSADPALSNVHCAPPVCRHRISGSLSLPSRGPFHLSFTVLCAIGHQGVFSLTGWSPLFPTKFLVFRGTLDLASFRFPSLTGLSPSSAGFSKTFLLRFTSVLRGPYPGVLLLRFGLPRVRSPLLTGSLLFSFPPPT